MALPAKYVALEALQLVDGLALVGQANFPQRTFHSRSEFKPHRDPSSGECALTDGRRTILIPAAMVAAYEPTP